jgi:hypothetical protein
LVFFPQIVTKSLSNHINFHLQLHNIVYSCYLSCEDQPCVSRLL